MIEIYADGSAKNNGKENNCGGAGVCVISQGKVILTASHQEQNVTNNQMELKGLIYALELSQTLYNYDNCIIRCDSAYCVNMFNDWIDKWQRNNWTRMGNKPVENLELVKRLWEYKQILYQNFRIERVPGHAGNLGNEIADALATNDQAKLDKIFSLNDIEPTKIIKFDI